MRIIDMEGKIKKPKPQALNCKNRKNFNLYYWLVICCLAVGVLPGCVQKNDLEKAQEYDKQSIIYYERAAKQYKELISRGGDSEQLYFKLGKLYYRHKDFEKAVEAFKNTHTTEARKLMAISYYELGDFTSALEVFDRQQKPDDELLFYHGLTCEKLNLFDKALQFYKEIKNIEFLRPALERINIIEKQTNADNIKNIDPKIGAILSGAPDQKKYPQAGALILYCDEKIEITPRNTQISYLHYLVKILNERGKEDFSEAHIDYDSTYDKVELEYARTIKPDGTVVDVGSRHIRDVSKYLNFPLYSNVRVYIISFPGITEGASIEYKLRISRNQLINKKDFGVTYPLQASEPIITANFTLDLPKGRTLNIKRLNEEYNDFSADLSPQVKEEKDRLIYNWQFKDIPQIIPESSMPPNVDINPSLIISTFNSWQQIYNWWWALAKDKIRADNVITEKVKELTRGLGSEEEKVRAIYNFCAQKIRYVAVEYGQAGYEPHSAVDIFKNNYGDCKDQAVLLVTMLKEAGFSAWPVLIPTKDCYNLSPEFPTVLFNHCIAAVSLKDKTVFLDPTAETCAFGDLPTGDQGRQVLVFKEDTFQLQSTPIFAAEHNLVKQHVRLKVNKDETINAEKSIFTYGVFDQGQRFWLIYTPPQLIEEALKEKIQQVSIGAILENYSIKNLENLNKPVVLNYAFGGPEYFTNAGKLRIMPQLAGLDTSLVAKDKRKYALDFEILDTTENIFEIEIPSNFALKYIPGNVFEDSPWLEFNIEYNFKSNKISCKENIVWKSNLVTVEEYPAFKKFFENLARKVKQRIVLERIR